MCHAATHLAGNGGAGIIRSSRAIPCFDKSTVCCAIADLAELEAPVSYAAGGSQLASAKSKHVYFASHSDLCCAAVDLAEMEALVSCAVGGSQGALVKSSQALLFSVTQRFLHSAL